MNKGRTIFSQIMDFFPHAVFQECVARYSGDRRMRSFSCHDQFCVLAFAQITYRESLRDIEACLRAMSSKLYHMGIRGGVSRSTLADAIERRDWRIYQDFALVLIERARLLYADEPAGVELSETIYALDSTTIDLCMSMFPWAQFRRKKSAVKLHTLLDIRGAIPAFIHISTGKMHDVKMLDMLSFEARAFYVFDKAYVDYERLYRIEREKAFFVTRERDDAVFRRQTSFPVDRTTGLRCDQRVRTKGFYQRKDYPVTLRRVGFRDPETRNRYVFLTNNFELPALTICELYKLRWQVELFFKWIKQHLRIKRFYGTSENAVKTQIWTAVATYVLIAIARKELRLDHSLHTLLQVFSLTIFEKIPIFQVFLDHNYTLPNDDEYKQLILF